MKNKNSKDLTDGDIVKDENGEYWLYLYGNYSSFEPDKRKWKKLIYKGISNHFKNLYSIILILKD